MKTITLKTDDIFFEKVNSLVKQLHITKNELIRRSVVEYELPTQKRAMKETMKDASLLVREANKGNRSPPYKVNRNFSHRMWV